MVRKKADRCTHCNKLIDWNSHIGWVHRDYGFANCDINDSKSPYAQLKLD